MVPENYRIEQVNINDADVRRMVMETGYPEAFSRLLIARGIQSREDAERFLNADVRMLHDPFLMKGMKAAVNRIIRALSRHEKITVYGDYDVDGITATSTLYLFLKDLRADIHYYLPDRLSEGYGLNEEAVRKIAADGTSLMVTVDTGITAVKECALAATLGMDVIVTDHHECQEELPKAVSVVDPKQPGETYPCKVLAGCGVAFKLVSALAGELDYTGDLFRLLELTAIGTVADIVPLTGENRIIVREGFKRLRKPSILGVRKLLESCDYDGQKKMTSGRIAFNVAPRLNAGGRMGDASRGVRLFTTLDEAEAAKIAADLDAENTLRKETEALILKQVTEKIEEDAAIRNSRIMVVSGDQWHHGVIGIVSSRIKEMYYRPNILLTIEDGIASGSARSIDGFNLFEALYACKDLMIKFGGHEAAAGMTLKAENIPELTRRLNAYAADHMDENMLIPVLRPEMTLMPSELTLDLIRMIEQMEPYGQGMPEPMIEIEGAVGELKAIGGDGKTLRMRLMDRKCSLIGVGFRKSELSRYYSEGLIISAIGHANLNVFNGREYPQIKIEALKKKTSPMMERMVDLFSLRHVTEGFAEFCMSMPQAVKEDCNQIYRVLGAIAKKQGLLGEGYFLMEDLSGVSGKTAADRIYKLLIALAVFEELGLMDVETAGMYLHYRMIPGVKAKLSDSKWYSRCFSA